MKRCWWCDGTRFALRRADDYFCSATCRDKARSYVLNRKVRERLTDIHAARMDARAMEDPGVRDGRQ